MSRVGKTALASLFLAVFLAMPALAADPASPARDQHGGVHAWEGSMEGLTVLDFAASWCSPCRTGLPRLQELAESHPDLRVLVVSVDDEVSGRDQLVADLDLRLPVLWDEGYAISQHYRPESMPTTLVLDASGEEVYRHAGSAKKDWQAFVAFVTERLAR
jgi:thiol-disulfide isomerase/thioredoxin